MGYFYNTIQDTGDVSAYMIQMKDMMKSEKFFKDPRMPFAECRYSKSSIRQFKTHMHKAFSVGAVDLGKVLYTVGETTTELAVGSLALINPETIHSCNCIEGNERSFYMLYLDADWCLEVQKSLWNVRVFQPVSCIRLDGQEIYDQYLKTMQVLMGNEDHLLKKEQILVELLSQVFVLACKACDEQAPTCQNVEVLRQKLGGDLQADLTLAGLAEELAVNPYTLLRQFKRITGHTPHAYRMNCRIEQAKIYLQQGLDIAETALECGFFDQSHLHRYFKSMTTVTPQEYRVNFVQ